ncbi:MAG: DUF4258 domain-containing protein [Thermodesulfobacteriota bacterium]|nr:DUF4258 domain-containing protein [Thermodesulfobacteriota bacterium]
MNIEENIKKKIKENRIIWRGHALKRMLERDISRNSVKVALQDAIIIEEYPDDLPFPSFLMLGFYKNTPLHVVCSMGQNYLFIITAYIPDSKTWENNFYTRRR